jgi:hypothetical protein
VTAISDGRTFRVNQESGADGRHRNWAVDHDRQVRSRLNGALVAVFKLLRGAGLNCKRKPRIGSLKLVASDGVESNERSLITTPFQRPEPPFWHSSLGKPCKEEGLSQVCHTTLPAVTSR